MTDSDPFDFRAPRLFVEAPLGTGASIEASGLQANYLGNVLRLRDGDAVLVFNGRDGEWRARLTAPGKRRLVLTAEAQTRPQPPAPVLALLFAPLKHARLDYMVGKAVEMGAGRLVPVRTRFTIAARFNAERARLNAIEAAEQCGILTIPEIENLQPLEAALRDWPTDAPLFWGDESAPPGAPDLSGGRSAPGHPLGVLIGPEGGFSGDERASLRSLPFARPISLGPRILRADTAAVAALALVQASVGDWRTAATSDGR